MIEVPSWQCYCLPSDNSPFDRGREERPLGVTIHMPASPVDLREAAALAVLREVAQLDSIAFADSAIESPRRIDMDPSNRHLSGGACPVTIQGPNEPVLFTGISHPQQWDDAASRVLQEWTIDPGEARRDVFIAAAHEALRYDLLVTAAPALLYLHRCGWLRHHTICSASEALKIVGLHLRCRDDYSVSGPPNARVMIDRSTFYLAAARSKVPLLWRHAATWSEIARTHHPVARLRGSVISRCQRALMARDAIGMQFYCSRRQRSEDTILYHFDYLTVLLVGALDASARLARIVYGVALKSKFASFWNDDFNRKLDRAGASGVAALGRSDELQALHTLLSGLRNTIHEIGLRSMLYQSSNNPPLSLIKLEGGGDKVWQATEPLGGPDAWGLLRTIGYEFEPYTYASKLVEVCFDLLGRIADATDAEGVLAPNASTADAAVPEWISPEIMSRCGLLA